MAELDSPGDVLKYLEPTIRDVRQRRLPIENRWLLNHHCWMGTRTRWYYADGVSEHYIPAGRRAIEKFVVRCRKQLIPSQDFFEVYPWDPQDPQQAADAEHVKAYCLYVMTKHMRVRTWIDQIIRSRRLYGRSIVKNAIKLIDLRVPMGGGPRTVKLTQVWPTSRNVDVFNWFSWPESATTLDDMQLIFEDVMMPYEEYRQYSERPGSEIAPIPRDRLTKPEWPIKHQIRLQAQGLTADPSLTAQGVVGDQVHGAQFVALTEAWFRRAGVWARAWIAWNVVGGPQVVWHQPSPYPEPPYRFSFDRQLPGEAYGTSAMSDIEPLNVWLNDEVNITQDARLSTIFNPILINPAAIMERESLTFRPRAKWLVDPEGVSFPRMSDVGTKVGMEGVQGVSGFIDAFSGSNPLADGQSARGLPRAGFAVTTIVQLAMADIAGEAEVLEDDILTPTLSDFHRLGVMFTPEAQRLRIPAVMGLPAREMGIADLYGDWAFRWVGSIQTQDRQVNAQRMVTFLGMMAKLGPLIQQSGLQVDWPTLIQAIWREGIGVRGSATLLKTMSPDQAALAMLMKAGMGGGGAGGNGAGQVAMPGVGANPATAGQANLGVARNLGESDLGQQLAGTGPPGA